MKKIHYLLIFLILIAAFAVRLYRFNGPVADWQSWRQADTSAVSRNFVGSGFDILHPRFDDLSNVPSGLDNPNGYRFVEFPLYNLASAGLYKVFTFTNAFTIEESGRLVTIFSSLLAGMFLFLLISKYRSKTAGFLALFFFSFLPFNVYYGRTILPDTAMVMASLGGIYFFDKWLNKNSKFSILNFQFLLALLFTASAFLLKPYALFFTLPMVYLAMKRFGFSVLIKWQLWVFLVFSTLPLIFWRIWMLQFPEGIASNNWLFNAGNIRFKGAFFYWLFGDRIARLILGFWGLPIFALGILSATSKKFQLKESGLFFFSFLISSLIYLFVIARGNVQHDYYQILIIPSIVIFLALGGEFLLKISQEYFSKLVSLLLFLTCLFLMFSLSWYFVRDYFNINNISIVNAGVAVDKLIPKNAKIIAIYDGDTSFLYQTKRRGWASFEKPLPEMINKMDAQYLLLANPTQNDYNFGKTYKIVSSSKEYILFNLKEK